MRTARLMTLAAALVVGAAVVLLLLGGFVTVWDSDAGEDIFILRIASSAARLEELKRVVGYSKAFGMPLEIISPQECLDLFPLMSLDDVKGGVYLPTDGQIDPTGLTNALAAGAKSRGAKLC